MNIPGLICKSRLLDCRPYLDFVETKVKLRFYEDPRAWSLTNLQNGSNLYGYIGGVIVVRCCFKIITQS